MVILRPDTHVFSNDHDNEYAQKVEKNCSMFLINNKMTAIPNIEFACEIN